MDDYAAFIKKYQLGIDLYANVDVIPNPELTWRNQKYLEDKHNLSPVPVVHYTTDLKWLRKYLDQGYPLIALGGLVGSTDKPECREWLDRAFDIVCDTPDRMPLCKIHGFGVTTYALLLRYNWWSVDSTTWTMVGAFGSILVPHKRRGEFTFDVEPYVMGVSDESDKKETLGRHFQSLTKGEQRIMLDWLELIGVPLGSRDKKGEVTEVGVATCTYARRVANLHFFDRMCKALPAWPWPLPSRRKKAGFGLV